MELDELRYWLARAYLEDHCPCLWKVLQLLAHPDNEEKRVLEEVLSLWGCSDNPQHMSTCRAVKWWMSSPQYKEIKESRAADLIQQPRRK